MKAKRCSCHSHNGLVLQHDPGFSPPLDLDAEFAYLDKSGSVSALVEVEGSYEEQLELKFPPGFFDAVPSQP